MTRLDKATVSSEMRLRVGAAPWELVQDDVDRDIGQWRVLDVHNRLVMKGSIEHASLAVYAVNELGTRTTGRPGSTASWRDDTTDDDYCVHGYVKATAPHPAAGLEHCPAGCEDLD